MMETWKKFALLCGIILSVITLRCQAGDGDGPMVTVPQLGKIKGLTMDTIFNTTFHAFRGIPYVQTPKRFKYAEPWGNKSLTNDSSPYDATYFRSRCPQTSYLGALGVWSSGVEDCLTLSIYTPAKNLTGLSLPVMYFIHGGSFVTGEALLYQPTRLMFADVVVVVVQYRLGFLGFLNGGTDDAPGNQGLHDMYQGIKWVNKHISAFGGNPGQVTLVGQSAGAASVALLMTSPLLRKNDLVAGFMVFSGSALEHWALDKHTPTESLEFAAQYMGMPSNTKPEDVVSLLGNTTNYPTVLLVNGSTNAIDGERMQGQLGFRGQNPVLQHNSTKLTVELVLEELPLDALRAGRYVQKPLYIGSVRDEGLLPLGILFRDYLHPLNRTNDTKFFKDGAIAAIANCFGYEDTSGAMSNSFRLAYMPRNLTLGNFNTMARGMSDMTGVLFLKSGAWKTGLTIANYTESLSPNTTNATGSPVFFYSYEYLSGNTLLDWIMMSSFPIPLPRGGVAHTDDLFNMFLLPSYLIEKEKDFAKNMITLYTNFMKHGNPTPTANNGSWSSFTKQWLPLSTTSQNFQLLQKNMTLESNVVKRWDYYNRGTNFTDPTDPHLPFQNMVGQQQPAEDEEPGKDYSDLLVGLTSAGCVSLLASIVCGALWRRRRISTGEPSEDIGMAAVSTETILY